MRPKSLRASVFLFVTGIAIALLLNLLQLQRKVTLFSSDTVFTVFSSPRWLLLYICFGLVAVVTGFMYPYVDIKMGVKHSTKREWSSIFRCVAVFVGISHASAKLDFASDIQFSLTLALLSVCLWWVFDRSWSGFLLGLGIALLSTFVAFLFMNGGYFRHMEPDTAKMYVRSWLPCVTFSGGITVGNIGRQLALFENSEKEHAD